MSKIFFILTLFLTNGETVTAEVPTLNDCIHRGLTESRSIVKFACEPGNLATRIKYFGLGV